ncbi:DUF6221 family protein [Streptomyces phaeoluteigriseus]
MRAPSNTAYSTGRSRTRAQGEPGQRPLVGKPVDPPHPARMHRSQTPVGHWHKKRRTPHLPAQGTDEGLQPARPTGQDPSRSTGHPPGSAAAAPSSPASSAAPPTAQVPAWSASSSGGCATRFEALHDPARVLREIEAKRRIPARHAHDPWPCHNLRDLASPYADHPDSPPEPEQHTRRASDEAARLNRAPLTEDRAWEGP